MSALAAALVLALPKAGLVVPGRSFGGVHLGATRAQVRTAWGTSFGRCRACARETWYFNYAPFRRDGAAVEFRGGRVAALFTIWRPAGWHTQQGLRIGDAATAITSVYGMLARVDCGTYHAYTLKRRRSVTAIDVVNARVWGFSLSRPGEPVCR
jgi:hypothetical protein